VESALLAVESANYPELNQFLWECGVYFVSDWAILNDTKSKQLRRILSEFYNLTEPEIHLACVLLESYHAVYRRDRLKQRRNQLTSGQARIKAPCLPPMIAQLDEIAQQVNIKTSSSIGTGEVLIQLQELAKHLRRYCTYLKEKLKVTAALDKRSTHPELDPIHWADFMNYSDDQDKPTEFLAFLPKGNRGQWCA
jgi:hypothetical protein